jgi:LAO/AO transport system kinase
MTLSDPERYIAGVVAGDRRALSKTITLMESARPVDQETARRVLETLLPRSGNAVRLGITGVPGVGKSTFIESFGMFLVERGLKVAVLAVDPSSSRSGGSIMADKTRMERLAADARAFIRPSPSGGTLGGVAARTRETLLVCEAAGFDVVIVETVGVGQSETRVASMVDFFLVLMLAGAGDELQGIKKGVLELADALAVNKADGDNRARAEQARRAYETALHLLAPPSPSWTPPVLACSALELNGIAAIWEAVCEHRRRLTASGELAEKRRDQARDWMWSLVEEGLRRRFDSHAGVRRRLPALLREVVSGRAAPTHAAQELLDLLDAPAEAAPHRD